MKEYLKNIILVFKNEKGFTLLELIFTMTITSIIMVSVLTIYQVNYSLVFNSSETSDKINKSNYINQVLTANLSFVSTATVSNDGNILTVDLDGDVATPEKMILTFDEVTNPNEKQLVIDINGDVKKVKGVEKISGTKVFAIEPNTEDISVNFLISDRFGNIPYSKFFKNTKKQYNKNFSIREAERIDEILNNNIGSGSTIVVSNAGDRMQVGTLIVEFLTDKIRTDSNGTIEEFTNLSKNQEIDVNGNSVNVPVFELDANGDLRVRFKINLPDYSDDYDKWYFTSN